MLNKWFLAFAGALAPGVVKGMLNEALTQKGWRAKDFSQFIRQNKGKNFIWLVDSNIVDKLKPLASDLEWLSLPWFIDAIIEEHRDIATLIVTSPAIQEELEKQLQNIKAFTKCQE